MKRGKYVILFLVAIFLIWYVFIKSYDYRITFSSRQAPGIIYSTLIAWGEAQPTDSLRVNTISKKPFSNLNQQLFVNDSIIDIQWSMERESDSITKIVALISDRKNSLKQKILVPFKRTNLVKRSVKTISEIRDGLIKHDREYNLSKVTEAMIPEQYCAYVELQSKIVDKANQMVKYNAEMLEYLDQNNVKFNGNPFLEVSKWDQDNDLITYNFCFPVPKKDDYLPSNLIKFKSIKSTPALKMVFYGNYRVSDRAWYSIIDYAKRKNYQIKFCPLEIFKNDPHNGGDELSWEADIYMPLIE